MQEEQKVEPQTNAQTPSVSPNNNETDEYKENIDKVYDVEGLLAGGAAGLFVGIIISFDYIFAMEIGMFLGLIVGTRLKKNKSEK